MTGRPDWLYSGLLPLTPERLQNARKPRAATPTPRCANCRSSAAATLDEHMR